MADFETGDVVRLGASFVYKETEQIVNVWTVEIVSGGPMAFAAAALEFAEYIDGCYVSHVGWHTTEFESDRISVKNETQDTVWGSIAFENPLVGTQVGDELPAQAACLAWGRTPISRVQIRKYLGPFADNGCVGGVWTSAIRADIQDSIDYHIVAQTMTGGLELIGVAYNAPLARATRALTATTAAVPVIQRRRRLGRGS